MMGRGFGMRVKIQPVEQSSPISGTISNMYMLTSHVFYVIIILEFQKFLETKATKTFSFVAFFSCSEI